MTAPNNSEGLLPKMQSPTRDTSGQHTTAWEGNTYMSHAEELQFAPVPRGAPPGVTYTSQPMLRHPLWGTDKHAADQDRRIASGYCSRHP